MTYSTICPRCQGVVTNIEPEAYDHVYNKHKDYSSLDYEVTDLVGYKLRYNCNCDKCGYQFTENEY